VDSGHRPCHKGDVTLPEKTFVKSCAKSEWANAAKVKSLLHKPFDWFFGSADKMWNFSIIRSNFFVQSKQNQLGIHEFSSEGNFTGLSCRNIFNPTSPP